MHSKQGKKHSRVLSTSATKQSCSICDQNVVNFQGITPVSEVSHFNIQGHVRAYKSTPSLPSYQAPGQPHIWHSLPSSHRLTVLWLPTEWADRANSHPPGLDSFRRSSVCLLRGLEGKGNFLYNSKVYVTQLQSIPGLTRKSQENSNSKKEKEESTEQLTAFNRFWPG